MLYSRLKLSKDRKTLICYVDMNTHERSCGESRSDWQRAFEIPLSELADKLNELLKSPEGTRIHL